MYQYIFSIFFLALVLVSTVHANTLPIAMTVSLVSPAEVTEGMVIAARESSGTYEITNIAADSEVFGVVATKPSLVFSQGEDQVPVLTEGVAFVRVNAVNGAIKRGDLLMSASSTGVAMRAGLYDEHVFAIALESYDGSVDGIGLIQAEIGVVRAQALRTQMQERALLDVDESAVTPSAVRAVVAATLVIGALFFVLYSFRSAIAQGVVSIGRNPRARGSIMTLSFANIVFALVLCAVIIFIAVAILIVPL